MPDPGSPPPAPIPSVLRLMQTLMRGRWAATGEDLYREVGREVEARPGMELLVAGCGDGVMAEWLAARTGATVTGVDADRARVERAERRRRGSERPLPLSLEHAPLADLPHETGVFDAAVGEPLLAAAPEAARSVRELVRVTKPMGVVVLFQLTWSSEIPPGARELLVERLGLRPHLLVEWKQMLRDAGVVEIQVQDWSEGPPGTRASRSGEFRRVSMAEVRRAGTRSGPPPLPSLSLSQKVHIVGRAWRSWGLRSGALGAARGALAQEAELLRAVARDRALGLQLIRGVKWPHAREPRDWHSEPATGGRRGPGGVER